MAGELKLFECDFEVARLGRVHQYVLHETLVFGGAAGADTFILARTRVGYI